MLTDVSLRDIGYVLALAKHLHFGRAAEACAVSQPALSKQVAQLEQQLGVRLFDRTKRTVRLTPMGQHFVEKARQLWHAGAQMLDVVQREGSFEQAPWRVGIIASVCPYVLPLIMAEVRLVFPRLTLEENLTEDLINALKAGRLDMVWAAETVQDPTLQVTPFYWEPFYLATLEPQQVENPVKPPYPLDPERLILLQDGHCLTDQTMGLCGLPNAMTSAMTAVRAQQLDTVIYMAASGLGNAVVPALAAKRYRGNKSDNYPKLSLIPFESEGRQLVLYTRHNNTGAAQLAHAFVTRWANVLQQHAGLPAL